MIETKIRWYTLEEKKPKNGEVLTVFMDGQDVRYITVLDVNNGHFNCSTSLDNELFPTYWANIPKINRGNW